MRASGVQELLDGFSDGHIVATAMQLLQELQRVADRSEMRRDRWRNAKRVENTETVLSTSQLPLEQLLIANREQCTSQRCKDRQLIVWPFDCGERCADCFHFLAIVKSLPADEYVTHAARLERLHVRLRDVVAEA